jgi:hypothetical protein
MADNAQNAQNLLLPQPNFPLLSQRYHDIANEVAKIPNAPQFDAGNIILRQLRQINENINTMSARITSLDVRIQIR